MYTCQQMLGAVACLACCWNYYTISLATNAVDLNKVKVAVKHRVGCHDYVFSGGSHDQ